MMQTNSRWIVIAAVALTLSAIAQATARGSAPDGGDYWGPRFSPPAQPPATSLRDTPERLGSTQWIDHWNTVAIDASGLDHTPLTPGENRVFGEQLGPGRSSRAMAIVHVAIFDAVNAVAGRYRSYSGIARARGRVSLQAAIAQAAHDTLVALFPSQTAAFDAELAGDLGAVRDPAAKAAGVALGRRAAAAILALRAGDRSQHAEPRVGIDQLGRGADRPKQEVT